MNIILEIILILEFSTFISHLLKMNITLKWTWTLRIYVEVCTKIPSRFELAGSLRTKTELVKPSWFAEPCRILPARFHLC